jgi:hypothetical protein
MQHDTVRIGLWLEELIECRDVQWMIVGLLHNIDTAVMFDMVEREIPTEIVTFRLFRRYNVSAKSGMFLFEDAVNDAKLRRRIHEYCEQYRFKACTKYRPGETRMTIRCDDCKREISDIEGSYNEDLYVRCECGYDINEDYPSDKVTCVRYFDEGCLSDEKKNVRHQKRYVSTGVMLIVDPRTRPTPSYKKFSLAKDESWRCKKKPRGAQRNRV